MLGYVSEEAALADYDAAFDDGRGPERRGSVTAMPVDEFKTWLKDGDTKKPVDETVAEVVAQPNAKIDEIGQPVQEVDTEIPVAEQDQGVTDVKETATTDASGARQAQASPTPMVEGDPTNLIDSDGVPEVTVPAPSAALEKVGPKAVDAVELEPAQLQREEGGDRKPAPGTPQSPSEQGIEGDRTPPSDKVRIRLNRRFDEERQGVRGDLDKIAKDVFGDQFNFELAESITHARRRRGAGCLRSRQPHGLYCAAL